MNDDQLSSEGSQSSAGPAHPSLGEARRYPLSFHGNGSEFFRIWIVNVALTVITLGFYTPWARVRTRKYFYGNTYLNDRNFTYLANPIALLKGFLIVVGGVIAYNVSGAFLPPLAILIFFAFMGVFPWLIYKSLRFKCHNSAYSNVRLRFRGACGESYGTFLGLAFLIPFTAGLILPYQAFRARKYVFDHLSLGKSESKTTIEAGKFYLYYLVILVPVALVFLIAMCAAIAVPVYNQMKERAAEPPEEEARIEAVEERRVFFAEGGKGSKLVLIQGDADADPGAGDAGSETPADEFEAMEPAIIAGVVVFYLLFLVVMIVAQQFIFVKTTNYTLTNTTLGSCRLSSNMRVREYLWIFVSNLFLILLTLGIYIPWATVRLRKYRLEHMAVYAYGDLQEFIAAEEAEQSAVGDAAGDYFDFEIGF